MLFLQNVVFQLDEEDMDSFVLVVGQKKALLKMQKEYEDLVSLKNNIWHTTVFLGYAYNNLAPLLFLLL